jgi:hypothetical protein
MPDKEPEYPLLERVTACVLCLVVAAVAWMSLVAYLPGWFRFGSVEVEIIAMTGLLAVALILVSVLALLHTRS